MDPRPHTTMSGVELDAVYGPADAERPGEFPYTRGPVRLDVPLAAVDHAPVRRLRHRRGHQRALPGAARRGRERPLDRVRHAHAARPRLRPRAGGRRGRTRRRRGRHPRRHGAAVRRHRPRRRQHVDDDQLRRDHPAGDVRGARRPARRRPGAPRRHDPERHPEGVPGAEGVRVPAAPVDAARHRRRALRHRRAPPLASGVDLRLPHPRGGLDGRAGARVHARQRLRLRRVGARDRPRRRRVRAPAQLLLQRARRLLRGDRQVPRRPAHLGAVDARRLRRARADARSSCASTPRPRASRSPRSNPRSTSRASRSRRWPRCSAARRACTPTRTTRRSRCPRNGPRASRSAPSR